MAERTAHPVVVGYDGSPSAAAAVALAADEAALRHVPLTLTHVLSERHPALTDTCAPEWTDLEGEWRRRTAMAAAAGGERHPGLVVTTDVVWGDPAAVLAERSATAAVVVVGRRRGCGLPGTSVVPALIERGAAPILVHRPAARPGRDLPVLVGVDASVAAEPVVAFAFLEAALRGAPLVAMHLWSRPAHSVPAGIHSDRYGYAGARADEQRMLAEALAGWSEKYPEVAVSRTVQHTLDPGRTLADNSRWAQLVVIGTSHRPTHRLAPPPTSRVLAEHAGCAVAIVPTDPGQGSR